MEQYLRTPIKDVIGRFPAVGAILDRFGIGCVPCSVGTCLLSDIVEIHALPPGDEAELLLGISSIVSPGLPVRLPERKRESARAPGKYAYSPPMKALVDEHRLIMRFVALVPRIIDRFDADSAKDRQAVRDAIDFIRSYADRYHHAKEEDILFAGFDPGLDILKAMQEDHRRGRAHVKETVEALDREDAEGVRVHLAGYAEVLTEHIRKEDGVLYPWMDRTFSTRQVGELFSKFREVDERFREARTKYETFVVGLEEKFQAQSAEAVR